MRPIYHLLPAASWDSTETRPYAAKSLEIERFIHCSFAHQVARTANLYFTAEPDLITLEIDADRLSVPVVAEDIGAGELFPHVYGPIDRGAVVAVKKLTRHAGGKWVWPDDNSNR